MGADGSKDIRQDDKIVVSPRWNLCKARIGGKTAAQFGNLNIVSIFEFTGDPSAFQTSLKVGVTFFVSI